MNRRNIHHQLGPMRRVHAWHLFVIAVVFAIVGTVALRQNNLRAIELRTQVYAADQADADVDKALYELRSYVYSHMNTNLATENGVYPPIQLKFRYERLVAAEKERVSNANNDVYAEAQKHCERQNSSDVSGRNRVPCIEKYVSTRSSTVSEKEIPDALYKFDFASPRWSWDLAGWSFLLATLFTIMSILRLALEIWVKNQHI